jgi:hypothetical protein
LGYLNRGEANGYDNPKIGLPATKNMLPGGLVAESLFEQQY